VILFIAVAPPNERVLYVVLGFIALRWSSGCGGKPPLRRPADGRPHRRPQGRVIAAAEAAWAKS
jgi:hypothetical protein